MVCRTSDAPAKGRNDMLFDTKLTPTALVAVLVTIALIATDLAADAYVYAKHQDPLWHAPLHDAALISMFLVNWPSAQSPSRRWLRTHWQQSPAMLPVYALVLYLSVYAFNHVQNTITPRLGEDIASGVVLLTLIYGLWRNQTLPPRSPAPA